MRRRVRPADPASRPARGPLGEPHALGLELASLAALGEQRTARVGDVLAPPRVGRYLLRNPVGSEA